MSLEAAAFIRAHLPLREVEGTGLRLHLAGPESRLSRLVPPGGAPYWAHAWPGGVALARYLLGRPALAWPGGRALPVLEVGCGGGVAGIAAARMGHAALLTDPDPLAVLAARLNARANGARVVARRAGAPPQLRRPALVLAGDVFYDAEVAGAATAFLDALPEHVTILVGDPGRAFLPRERLEPLAAYALRDVGAKASGPAWVFRWLRPPRGR